MVTLPFHGCERYTLNKLLLDGRLSYSKYFPRNVCRGRRGTQWWSNSGYMFM